MRSSVRIGLCSLLLASGSIDLTSNVSVLVSGKKSSRNAPISRPRGRSSSSSSRRVSTSSSSSRAPVSKRRSLEESENEEEEDDFGDSSFLSGLDDGEENNGGYDEEEDSMEEEEMIASRPSRNSSRGPPPPRGKGGSKRPGRSNTSSSSRRPPPSRDEDDYDNYDNEMDDEYQYDDHRRTPPRRGSSSSRRGPPPRNSRSRNRGSSRGRSSSVVPYSSQKGTTFTRGLTAIRESMPDPTAVKNSAFGAISAAKEKTTKISSSLYREVKGLTSSELEQVMLKATKPDDTPVKGKHVERLVGVTYQISGRYDIYDAVLRKLWGKMTEQDWRTKIKALYVLHRFSSDGAPDHQASLKARLRELRRTRDPKRKDKFFNSKQLLASNIATKESAKYRAFLARYAHFVLLRAQAFGGTFTEIGQSPSSPSTSKKPITSTQLRAELFDAANLVLKAGCACILRDGEECEHTASAMERVASDMIALTSATATALNKVLKTDPPNVDRMLVQRWCVFYKEELLPKTKLLVKKTSVKLDKYGLFLPTRMGASVRGELLEKGLTYGEVEDEEEEEEEEEEEDKVAEEEPKGEEEVTVKPTTATEPSKTKKAATVQEEEEEEVVEEKEQKTSAPPVQEEENEYEEDAYDYEEVEEYYDEEE